MPRLAVGLMAATMLAGCSPELLSRFLPDPAPAPPGQGGEECFLVQEHPAQMFAVEAPATASAESTVSLQPWIFLTAPVTRTDELLPETFKADVDLAAKTVTVSGKVRRYQANPEAECAFPAIYVQPKPATLSLPVSLPAGTYLVTIASESFIAEHPPEHPAAGEYPQPMATRSLVVE